MIWQSTIRDLLVQQGLNQVLEDERSTSINEIEWTKIQRRVVNTIRLALAPEIKHNVLKETTPKASREKFENIYTSKSLTNRLCLKMELYQLNMEMGGDLHDHINKFNQLVSQLLNANDELSNEEQALLLLVEGLHNGSRHVQRGEERGDRCRDQHDPCGGLVSLARAA